MQEPAHLSRIERHGALFEQPPPSIADTGDRMPAGEGPPHDGPYHSIQSGRIASAREDPESRHGSTAPWELVRQIRSRKVRFGVRLCPGSFPGSARLVRPRDLHIDPLDLRRHEIPRLGDAELVEEEGEFRLEIAREGF